MTVHSKEEIEKRIVRLFKNGRSQAVRIPKEFEFEGEEVQMIKEGDKVTLKPIKQTNGLTALLKTMKPLDEKDWFPDIDDDDLLPLKDINL